MPRKQTSKKAATEEKTEALEPKPPRKIVFSSDRATYGDPPSEVKIGIRTISLPGAEEQLAGFKHPDAALIKKSVRGYRWLEAKGAKGAKR